jgi:hypothetical protein
MEVDSNQTDFETDFIYKSSKMATKSNFTLPLYGYLKNLKLESMVPYILSDSDFSIDENPTATGLNFKDLEARIRLYYENRMPLQVYLQVYFLDRDSVAVDSLFNTRYRIKGGITNANGIVTSAYKSEIEEIVFTTARVKKIQENTTNIKFSVSFLSADAEIDKSVRFYPTNNIAIQLSTFFKGTISTTNE